MDLGRIRVKHEVCGGSHDNPQETNTSVKNVQGKETTWHIPQLSQSRVVKTVSEPERFPSPPSPAGSDDSQATVLAPVERNLENMFSTNPPSIPDSVPNFSSNNAERRREVDCYTSTNRVSSERAITQPIQQNQGFNKRTMNLCAGMEKILFVYNLPSSCAQPKDVTAYFQNFGSVVSCVFIHSKWKPSRRSYSKNRRFGLYAKIKFNEISDVDAVQAQRPHIFYGTEVFTRRFLPIRKRRIEFPHRESCYLTIPSIAHAISNVELRNYFCQFGNVINCVRQETFAVIKYDDYDPVDKALVTMEHIIGTQQIEVMKCDDEHLIYLADNDTEVFYELSKTETSRPDVRIPDRGYNSSWERRESDERHRDSSYNCSRESNRLPFRRSSRSRYEEFNYYYYGMQVRDEHRRYSRSEEYKIDEQQLNICKSSSDIKSNVPNNGHERLDTKGNELYVSKNEESKSNRKQQFRQIVPKTWNRTDSNNISKSNSNTYEDNVSESRTTQLSDAEDKVRQKRNAAEFDKSKEAQPENNSGVRSCNSNVADVGNSVKKFKQSLQGVQAFTVHAPEIVKLDIDHTDERKNLVIANKSKPSFDRKEICSSLTGKASDLDSEHESKTSDELICPTDFQFDLSDDSSNDVQISETNLISSRAQLMSDTDSNGESEDSSTRRKSSARRSVASSRYSRLVSEKSENSLRCDSDTENKHICESVDCELQDNPEVARNNSSGLKKKHERRSCRTPEPSHFTDKCVDTSDLPVNGRSYEQSSDTDAALSGTYQAYDKCGNCGTSDKLVIFCLCTGCVPHLPYGIPDSQTESYAYKDAHLSKQPEVNKCSKKRKFENIEDSTSKKRTKLIACKPENLLKNEGDKVNKSKQLKHEGSETLNKNHSSHKKPGVKHSDTTKNKNTDVSLKVTDKLLFEQKSSRKETKNKTEKERRSSKIKSPSALLPGVQRSTNSDLESTQQLFHLIDQKINQFLERKHVLTSAKLKDILINNKEINSNRNEISSTKVENTKHQEHVSAIINLCGELLKNNNASSK